MEAHIRRNTVEEIEPMITKVAANPVEVHSIAAVDQHFPASWLSTKFEQHHGNNYLDHSSVFLSNDDHGRVEAQYSRGLELPVFVAEQAEVGPEVVEVAELYLLKGNMLTFKFSHLSFALFEALSNAGEDQSNYIECIRIDDSAELVQSNVGHMQRIEQ
ncbi:hypothetical protein GYMLUDRAFT_60398 [Collybiopsis luxurians FD-317 M1]|uniref:Uncharacterized protein n=1 Tax=Collybiopsis luxurians FD-317 M1 TaxID=944289 RepID=A0A0D0B6X0_9AGAR|nr:hypothetical protein GYMLUDRAFT_60398 [Collybiopsis luxurians FD-317 M1]